MNYQTLLEILLALPKDARRDNVTVKVNGEFLPITDSSFASDIDVLDEGHFFLEVSE